ncbi:MAG: hypothetical protein HQK61_06770 [Desulfamplus sp.]|nr:hypothetical protein [Desulfamplus sp.]
MTLKGFSQNDYADQLLDFCKSNLPDWQDKTRADILDIAQTYSINLEEHYQSDGWKLDLSPNRYFNPDEYRLAWAVKHPEDALDGIDPYQHYLDIGAARNINPSNAFDESEYINFVLKFYQQDSPDEWGGITYESLMQMMASAGVTALSVHTDYNLDESIFPVFAVPPNEAVNATGFTTLSIDTGELGTPELFDASGKGFKFVEDPTLSNSVEIIGFSKDDFIEVSQSKSPNASYFFTNEGSDVAASINISGVVSVIKLIGILGSEDVILDGTYDSLKDAVGFDAFVFV